MKYPPQSTTPVHDIFRPFMDRLNAHIAGQDATDHRADRQTTLVGIGSDEHVAILDRVGLHRAAQWLCDNHGDDPQYAQEVVEKVVNIYLTSTRGAR